uniref:HDC02384 n=1 Tax=Drosophila melanogaster TaxID=7227 RepID=Q6IHK0_DROME|nr:TPA_inf: HDC02384 [Drosophila melanogaster]
MLDLTQVPAKDKQNLYLCEWTLKSNDKSLVRRQKQTVAEQFVVKCKLKAVDDKDIDYYDDDEEDEADDEGDDAGDGDGDGDGGSWYDFGANEKEKANGNEPQDPSLIGPVNSPAGGAASTPCRQHFACKAKCNINKPGPKTKRNMSTCHTKHQLPLGPGQPPDIERRTWYTGTQNFSWWTRNTPRNFKLNYVRSPVPKAGTDKTSENAQMDRWLKRAAENWLRHMELMA